MDTIMRIVLGVMIGIALIIGPGCAPSKKVWVSNPVFQTAHNPYYNARIEPLTRERDFFVSFRLTVSNKMDKNIEIDWNKTRYIHNGRTLGGFVFKEIKPEDVKNATIPPDTILAGGFFSREIMPYKLLARAPIRVRGKGINESGIQPGILPNGENGILLVVRQNSKQFIEKITLNIEEKENQR